MRLNYFSGVIFIVLSFIITIQSAGAEQSELYPDAKVYQVHPGDLLTITVWKEDGLQQDVLVRPDGGVSFPLAGDFQAQGHSLIEIQEIVKQRLNKYISNPVVTVSARQLLGNKIYVIGKVGRPGEYVADHNIDVMQALSMAGGMTTFSAVNDIKILRRDKLGKQYAIEFRYGDIEDGEDLEQNIILKSGDIVVVP